MTAFVLCRTRSVPTPEQVADALRQHGYDAFVERECGHLTTSVAAEIRYAPNRMPIVIKFMHDLHDAPDEGDYEYWDWLAELVPDAITREGIRRFIFISGMENANTEALQITLDYLHDQTNATVIRLTD